MPLSPVPDHRCSQQRRVAVWQRYTSETLNPKARICPKALHVPRTLQCTGWMDQEMVGGRGSTSSREAQQLLQRGVPLPQVHHVPALHKAPQLPLCWAPLAWPAQAPCECETVAYRTPIQHDMRQVSSCEAESHMSAHSNYTG